MFNAKCLVSLLKMLNPSDLFYSIITERTMITIFYYNVTSFCFDNIIAHI